MGIPQKVVNNMFSKQAISVLGPGLYLRYLATCISKLPAVLKSKDFKPIDKAMGSVPGKFYFRGNPFIYDCAYGDAHSQEESYAFGLVRELYMQDCYFRWQPPRVYENAKNVVDLGANRGAFSSLITTKASKIVSVECQPEYVPIIKHNLEANKFQDFAIETAFIGEGGAAAGIAATTPTIGLIELFDKHKMDKVDFVKMDIEGSEYPLFEKPDWLDRVNAISMEVHPDDGDPTMIVEALRKKGFEAMAGDDDLGKIENARRARFVFGWRN